ncbi:hypothetical protein [Fervidibacter sacchari]
MASSDGEWQLATSKTEVKRLLPTRATLSITLGHAKSGVDMGRACDIMQSEVAKGCLCGFGAKWNEEAAS